MKRVLSTGDLSISMPVDADLDPQCLTQMSTRSKKARKKTQGRAKSSKAADHQLISTADDSVCPATDSQPKIEALEINTDPEVARLRSEIEQLKNTVSTLTGQLSFVLSYIGVTTGKPDDDQFPSLSTANSNPATSSTNTNTSAACPPTMAQVVKQSLQTVPPSTTLKGQLTKDLLSAVYVDFESKKRRSNNVIISGFPEGVNGGDRYSVENFLQVEFPAIDPGFKITGCRRLGICIEGRVRPLLVSFESTSEASFLLQNARCLRKSTTSYVREGIYINPDLTKAEAAAAYELRQKRRVEKAKFAAKLKNTDRHGVVADSVAHSSSTGQTSVQGQSFHSNVPGPTGDTLSPEQPTGGSLNANALQFIPCTSQSTTVSACATTGVYSNARNAHSSFRQ